MSRDTVRLAGVVAALSVIGVNLASDGDDVLRIADEHFPPLPSERPKRRVAAIVAVPIAQGPITRQQRRAAERAAFKRLPA